MDRLLLAKRRYGEILSNQPKGLRDFPRRHQTLEAWLVNDVGLAVAERVNHPDFRKQATWSLVQLKAGANSKERLQIEVVAQSLVTCAKTLTRLAKNAPLAEVLKKHCPPQEVAVKEAVPSDNGYYQRLSREKGIQDPLALELSLVEQIADRFWTDLVCPNDYFQPRGEWELKDPQVKLYLAEFMMLPDPKLLPVGDLISRTMLQRVENLIRVIHSARNRCLAAHDHVTRGYPKQIADMDNAWEQLKTDYRSLQSLILAIPALQIRESCMILTQVYAAFQPSPDLRWLSLPQEVINVEAASLRCRLASDMCNEIADRVAASLEDLHKLLGSTDTSEQTVVKEAIASRGLVLVEESRQAYWDGDPIEAKWNRYDVSWRFLMVLAQKAPRSSPVGEADLFDKAVGLSAMSTEFGRLKSRLPASLWSYIRPVKHPPRTYRLDLPSNRVFIFEQQ